MNVHDKKRKLKNDAIWTDVEEEKKTKKKVGKSFLTDGEQVTSLFSLYFSFFGFKQAGQSKKARS